MTIEQTVEIPADHRLTLDVPREIPPGTTILTFTPAPAVPPEDGPPAEDEFDRICDFAKTLPRPEGVYRCEEILDAAATTADAGAAREYRLMAAKIRCRLSRPELWPESVRTVRAMRDEWDDPWKQSPNG
jgi:hypothetical protein